MFGVLLSHVLLSCYDLHTADYTWANAFRMYLMNASIVCVNCFVLISGYYGIKISVKGVVKLYCQCFFYGLLIFLLFGIKNCPWNYYTFRDLIFACSQNSLWFIPAYLGLMFVSPLLNAAFEHSNPKERLIQLGALLFVNVYMGYMHQVEEINHLGTNLFQLITIYYAGRYIYETPKYENIKWGILSLFMFGVMTILHALKMRFFPISVIYSLHHNAPTTIIASFLVFQYFRNLKIQSKWVNYIACSVLPVYLLHMHKLAKTPFLDYLFYKTHNLPAIHQVLSLTTLLVGFFCLCIIIDKIRIFLFQGLETRLSNKISAVINHRFNHEN